jgi:hypothetical protein
LRFPPFMAPDGCCLSSPNARSHPLPYLGECQIAASGGRNAAKALLDSKMQRALMQFFEPENYFMVREALLKAGRGYLIGSGCDCLIRAQPPKEDIHARMEKATQSLGEGNFVHQIPNAESSQGYGPGRRTARRQDMKRKR